MTERCTCTAVWYIVSYGCSAISSMPIYVWEAIPLEAILLCGTANDLVELADVAAAGATCISLLYCCGQQRNCFVYCRRHRRYHRIGIFSTCTDPFNSLAVFDESLQYAMGMAEYQEEFFIELGDQVEDYYGNDSETNWRGFIVYRAWCIYWGFEPELSIRGSWRPTLLRETHL